MRGVIKFFLGVILSLVLVSANVEVGFEDAFTGGIEFVDIVPPAPATNFSGFPIVNSSDLWDALDTPADINLGDLGDVTLTSPTQGAYLAFIGSSWIDSFSSFNDTVKKLFTEQQVVYNASTIVTEVGTLDSGNLESIKILGDGDTYNISEVSGTPGWVIAINFTNVTNFNTVAIRGKYEGGAGHTVALELYRFGTGTWEERAEITDQMDFGVTTFQVFIGSNFIDNGNVSFRINHDDVGNINHNYFLDAAFIGQVTGLVSGGDLEDLTGRDEACELLPDVFCKDGSKNMSGNLNMTNNNIFYNISFVDWFNGFNFINGSGNFITTGNITATNLIVSNISGGSDINILDNIIMPFNNITTQIIHAVNLNVTNVTITNLNVTNITITDFQANKNIDISPYNFTTTGGIQIGIGTPTAQQTAFFNVTRLYITGAVGESGDPPPPVLHVLGAPGFAQEAGGPITLIGGLGGEADGGTAGVGGQIGISGGEGGEEAGGTGAKGGLVLLDGGIGGDGEHTGEVGDVAIASLRGRAFIGTTTRTDSTSIFQVQGNATINGNLNVTGNITADWLIGNLNTTSLYVNNIFEGTSGSNITFNSQVDMSSNDIRMVDDISFRRSASNYIDDFRVSSTGQLRFHGEDWIRFTIVDASAALILEMISENVLNFRGNEENDNLSFGKFNRPNLDYWSKTTFNINKDNQFFKAGAGIGQGGDMQIGFDGTNAVYNLTTDGVHTFYNSTGLGAVRSEEFITGSYVPDTKSNTYLGLLDNIDDWINQDGSINYLSHYAYVQVPITDYDNCWQEVNWVEYCLIDYSDMCYLDLKDIPKGYDYNTKTYYRTECGTKLVDGLGLGKRAGDMEGMISELIDENILMKASLCNLGELQWC